MNSFDSYKGQVYNIGSPTPSPSGRSPLENLPVNSKIESDFEFSTEEISNSDLKELQEVDFPKVVLQKVQGNVN